MPNLQSPTSTSVSSNQNLLPNVRNERLNGSPPKSLPQTMSLEPAIPEELRAVLNASVASVGEMPETTEEQVARLRPKSLRLQLRFAYTVLFALWLFGRLIFWQVYIARYFPKWVATRNTARWTKYAREFRAFALQMGCVQIKMGQFASTRADLLPEGVLRELSGLQDRVPSVPFDQIKQVLERELGDIDLHFASIHTEPIASASLGQVYKAQLKNGDKVVVKVQRPNMRELILTDLSALFRVAHIAMVFPLVHQRADAVALMNEFGRVLLEEVSYYKERDNAKRFYRMFEENQGVYVPTVYEEHSTDYVLTLEDVTSVKIDDFAGLAKQGISRKEVAKRLMETYVYQIFKARFFHADPHPGNLFVYPLPVKDPQPYIERGGGRPFYLIFIDFGMTGTLTPEITKGLLNTVSAILTRDAKKLVASYQELGFLLPNADTKRIEEAVTAVFNNVWGLNMLEITNMDYSVVANLGKEFSDLLFDLPFRVPQDFIYLGRSVSILSGMSTSLDPDFNPWASLQEGVQELLVKDAQQHVLTDFFQTVTAPVQNLLMGNVQGFIGNVQTTYDKLTRNQTNDILRQLASGELQIETKLSQFNRRQLEKIEAQGRRTTRAFLTGSLLISGTLFYTNGDMGLAMLAYGLMVSIGSSLLFS